VADEAHYFYSFSVNPANYNDYVALDIDGFEGYTTEAFEKFKKGCLVAATAHNTNSKVGCENEFALFITCKEGSNLYLANIDAYVDFRKEGAENFINLEKISKLLTNKMDQIENIEIYYNDIDTMLELGGLKCSVNSLY